MLFFPIHFKPNSQFISGEVEPTCPACCSRTFSIANVIWKSFFKQHFPRNIATYFLDQSKRRCVYRRKWRARMVRHVLYSNQAVQWKTCDRNWRVVSISSNTTMDEFVETTYSINMRGSVDVTLTESSSRC